MVTILYVVELGTSIPWNVSLVHCYSCPKHILAQVKLANICVDITKPITELRIMPGIIDHYVERISNGIEGSIVGKARRIWQDRCGGPRILLVFVWIAWTGLLE